MNVILDTSIIVEYSIDGIKDFIINDDRVFLTDIILQEMDGHKNSEEAKGYNAREFFRQMGNSKSEKANLSDIVLKDNDYISKYTLSNGLEIYTIVRNRYNSRDINDSKIIEIAKDYNLKLITRDMAQSVRAKAMGVEVEVVTGDKHKKTSNKDLEYYEIEVKDISSNGMEDMLNQIKSWDCDIYNQIKQLCNVCDDKFDDVKKEVITRMHHVLKEQAQRVKYKHIEINNNIVKNNNTHSDFHNSHFNNNKTFNPIYSDFGGNIHNED